MATLKTQQKEKLVEMLSKYYKLDIEEFIGCIASDYTDRLELMLIAYSLMGKEKTPTEVEIGMKQVRIYFNPYPEKLRVVKSLKETPELHLDLKTAKEIVDSRQIVVNASLSEITQDAICIAGGNIERVEKL